jgi:hypothetical protein
MHAYQMRIKDTSPDFLLRRASDQLWRPLFHGQGIRGQQLHQINLCRLFLQLFTIQISYQPHGTQSNYHISYLSNGTEGTLSDLLSRLNSASSWASTHVSTADEGYATACSATRAGVCVHIAEGLSRTTLPGLLEPNRVSIFMWVPPKQTSMKTLRTARLNPDNRAEGRLHREIERALHPIIEEPGNVFSISRDVELADHLEQPGNAFLIPRYQVD